MKKELSPTTAGIVIGIVVIAVAAVLIFGAWKPKFGAGPVVKPRPWSPSGYAGVPAGAGKTEAPATGVPSESKTN